MEEKMPNMSEKKVDDDWKEQAQKEKEKLEKEFEEEKAKQEAASKLPPASFLNFLSGLATQTLIQLGEIENPFTKEKTVSLDEARYTIDLLEILEKKTENNLTEDEKKYLTVLLYDLRMRFVQASGKK